MGFQVDYHEHWIHVRYTDTVDAYDIVQQAGDEKFLEALGEKKRVIYDYTSVTKVSFNDDDVERFAVLGRLHGDLHDTVKVAVLVSSEKGQRQAQAYKTNTESSRWQVSICLSMKDAEHFLLG